MDNEWTTSPQTFLARVDGEGVLLDLRGDNYFGLSAVSATIWASLESGSSVEEIGDRVVSILGGDPSYATAIVQRQLRNWSALGLIVANSGSPCDQPCPVARVATACTKDAAQMLALDIMKAGRARSYVNVGRSMLWAKGQLKRGSLPRILRALQNIPAPDSAEVRLGTTVQTLRAYKAMRRPFALGKSDCLPRSLALSHCLRHQGIDALFCLGVRKYPFFAHAWVQSGDLVLNDSWLSVSELTLIAAF